MANGPRPIEPGDIDWVHALNQRHAVELSALTVHRLVDLVERATYAKVIDDQAGFLLAFERAADYDSPNFLWFRKRFDRFIYVDRIAISDLYRGQGVARTFYQDLFEHAAKSGHQTIVCEVNSKPPNPGSDAFHAALGFMEVGEAALPDGSKSVRYLKRDLGSQTG